MTRSMIAYALIVLLAAAGVGVVLHYLRHHAPDRSMARRRDRQRYRCLRGQAPDDELGRPQNKAQQHDDFT